MHPLHPRLFICLLLATVSGLPFVLQLPVQQSRRYRYARCKLLPQLIGLGIGDQVKPVQSNEELLAFFIGNV